MKLDRGWLTDARHCHSPNYNERPADTVVDLLLIHNISLPPGQFGTGAVQQFFCNELDCAAHPYFEQLRELQVSAHLLIERDGSITQFVPLHARAWHAGESCFEGQHNCNDYSIGIEVEGTDEEAYTEAQYIRLAEVTKLLLEAFPALRGDRIVGHADVAPGRKTDPGAAFDWDHYRALIAPGENDT